MLKVGIGLWLERRRELSYRFSFRRCGMMDRGS